MSFPVSNPPKHLRDVYYSSVFTEEETQDERVKVIYRASGRI